MAGPRTQSRDPAPGERGNWLTRTAGQRGPAEASACSLPVPPPRSPRSRAPESASSRGTERFPLLPPLAAPGPVSQPLSPEPWGAVARRVCCCSCSSEEPPPLVRLGAAGRGGAAGPRGALDGKAVIGAPPRRASAYPCPVSTPVAQHLYCHKGISISLEEDPSRFNWTTEKVETCDNGALCQESLMMVKSGKTSRGGGVAREEG